MSKDRSAPTICFGSVGEVQIACAEAFGGAGVDCLLKEDGDVQGRFASQEHRDRRRVSAVENRDVTFVGDLRHFDW